MRVVFPVGMLYQPEGVSLWLLTQPEANAFRLISHQFLWCIT